MVDPKGDKEETSDDTVAARVGLVELVSHRSLAAVKGASRLGPCASFAVAITGLVGVARTAAAKAAWATHPLQSERLLVAAILVGGRGVT